MADTPLNPEQDDLKRVLERLERLESHVSQLVERGVIPPANKKPADTHLQASGIEAGAERNAVAEENPATSYADASPATGNTWSSDAHGARPPESARQPGHQNKKSVPAATVVMGLTAAAAFVLAAVYFVKLVYDAGWLTPGLQIGLATVSGIALIAAGTLFGRHDKSYAAYLPAVGIVVVYLAIFAGHIHYQLFGAQFAMGAVALTTLCAMWLARQFDNSVYILFAVVGVYITPVLMEYLRASVLDLVIYYTAWSLLFSFASIHEGRRTAYILAMLFAIIGFDLAWRVSGANDWTLAVIYQFAQFLIFAITTYLFSARHQSNLTGAEALVHGVALFYFYLVEYFTLHEHVPELAPWIALASVVVVLLIYALASKRLASQEQLVGSALLASSYASVVTAHVVFLELIPPEYFAWSALFAPVAAGFASRLFTNERARLPLYLVSGGILIIGFISAFAGRAFSNQIIPNSHLLLFVYAVVLYGAFLGLRRNLNSSRFATLVLYAAHAALLVATLQAFENDILISVLWGVFALVLLLWAIKREDPVIGKSSLLIFAASGLKVLLHDLDDSAQFTRILVLIVLSISLYAGGWLYQKVNVSVREFTGNPLIDKQITRISSLLENGYSNAEISNHFVEHNEILYGSDDHWTESRIAEIRQAFGL